MRLCWARRQKLVTITTKHLQMIRLLKVWFASIVLAVAGSQAIMAQTILAFHPNLLDLPSETYGGTLRLEPGKYFYIEGFGSWRPLKLRGVPILTELQKLTGTVFDGSAGLQIRQPLDATQTLTYYIGPVIQHKKFSGRSVPSCFLIMGDCGSEGPREVDFVAYGLRAGINYRMAGGFYVSAYGGFTKAKPVSEADIIATREKQGIDIRRSKDFLHARLGIGYAFQW